MRLEPLMTTERELIGPNSTTEPLSYTKRPFLNPATRNLGASTRCP
jgi:hypothetical protein